MARYLVVLGNPVEGLTFYGPFSDYDAACEWTDKECRDVEWWIAPITSIQTSEG